MINITPEHFAQAFFGEFVDCEYGGYVRVSDASERNNGMSGCAIRFVFVQEDAEWERTTAPFQWESHELREIWEVAGGKGEWGGVGCDSTRLLYLPVHGL